jgi:hypothetical protein
MAKQNKEVSTTYSVSLTVPDKHIPDIKNCPAASDIEPIAAKVAWLAECTLLDFCEGALILQAPVVKKMAEAFGRPITSIDTVVEMFQRGVGRKDGKMQITISLDPAYEGVAQQAAEFQGRTIPEVMQDAWDTAWDNGDFYDPRPHADRVLMTLADKKELVEILGKDFSTGTELAGLIKTYAADHEGLFSEVTK